MSLPIYSSDWPGITAPAAHAVAVTPNDGTDLTYPARALYVGGAGDVVVIMHGGETTTFKAVQVGTVLPLIVTRVKSTGTTATNIVALW